MRDQFVYGVSDDDLKKKLLEKGNTLTRIQAVSIGKAHETTNQEVQECCLKPPVSDTVLPGEQCVAFARLKIILKIPRNVSDSKRRENQNQEIKTSPDQLGNHLS